MKKVAVFLMVALGLFSWLLVGCSKKGAVMPKHRKRTKCDCPYFSSAPQTENEEIAEWR